MYDTTARMAKEAEVASDMIKEQRARVIVLETKLETALRQIKQIIDELEKLQSELEED